MKCFICDTELGKNAKVCPCCGKIYTAKDMQKLEDYNNSFSDDNEKNVEEKTVEQQTEKNNTTAEVKNYSAEPVAEGTQKEETQFIGNQDAPQYRDERDDFSFNGEMSDRESEPFVEREPEEQEQTMKQSLDEDDIPVQKQRMSKKAKGAIIAVVLVIVLAVATLCVYKVGNDKNWWGKKPPKTVVDDDTTAEDFSNTSVVTQTKKNKPGYYKIQGEQMNALLYKSPMATASVIATIPRTTVIIATEIENDIYGKTKFGTYEGFVDLRNCVFLPTLGEEKYTGVDDIDSIDMSDLVGSYTVFLNGDNDYLNVRDAADTSGTAIGRLNEGDNVEVLEVKNGWGKITYNGVAGWVSMTYLKGADT